MASIQTESIEWTEFQMKVPWGHIAGKWWGPRNVQPILTIHGWQDNAGSFDTLIPLLPKELSFLAIDMPGHGFSSYFPNGMEYYFTDQISVILRIMKELNCVKLSILGHSIGAVVGSWFAAMFPNKVNWLIVIDVLKPLQQTKENYWEDFGVLIQRSMRSDELNAKGLEPPSYTYEECIDRLFTANSSVERDKCQHLLKRNLKESKVHPNKYYFLRDGRLKHMNKEVWPQGYYVELASRVKIPHLVINAFDASYNEPAKNVNETMAMLRKNPLFEYVDLPGRHHVHLNDPENVSKVIKKFLDKYSNGALNKSKL